MPPAVFNTRITTGIVEIAGGGAAIDLDEAILGVVSVSVAGVLDHVASRVVPVCWTEQLVLRVHVLTEAAGSDTGGLVGAVTPGIDGPRECVWIGWG